MLTIVHTPTTPTTVEKIRAALPDCLLVQANLDAICHLVIQEEPGGLLVDGSVLGDRDVARLSMIKMRHPWLVMIGLVPPDAEFLRRSFTLGHLGLVDDVLVSGIEDSPVQIRATLARARMHTVAATVEFACSPLPAALARPRLYDILRSMPQLKHARDLASALGTSLPRLREELLSCRLFPPKALLGRLRLLVATRMLQDSTETVERIGLSLYASPTAFHNAFREELGVTPTEVRRRGGLRFAGQLLRVAIQAWRAKIA